MYVHLSRRARSFPRIAARETGRCRWGFGFPVSKQLQFTPKHSRNEHRVNIDRERTPLRNQVNRQHVVSHSTADCKTL